MERTVEKLAKALRGYEVLVYRNKPPEGVAEHLHTISRESGDKLTSKAFGHHFEPGKAANPIVLVVRPKDGVVMPSHVDGVFRDLKKAEGILRENKIRALCTSIPNADYLLISLNRKSLVGWLGKRGKFTRLLKEKLHGVPK
ncbi:MAG: hypothetical protein Q8R15_00525 [Candidatus Micrarchaeota archaeon]|nr:hypothetical protein [Candidatus Micrarchaeota archaeon]